MGEIFYAWRKPDKVELVRRLMLLGFTITGMDQAFKIHGIKCERSTDNIKDADTIRLWRDTGRKHDAIHIDKHLWINLERFDDIEQVLTACKSEGYGHKSPLWFWLMVILMVILVIVCIGVPLFA